MRLADALSVSGCLRKLHKPAVRARTLARCISARERLTGLPSSGAPAHAPPMERQRQVCKAAMGCIPRLSCKMSVVCKTQDCHLTALGRLAGLQQRVLRAGGLRQCAQRAASRCLSSCKLHTTSGWLKAELLIAHLRIVRNVQDGAPGPHRPPSVHASRLPRSTHGGI